MVVHSKSAVFGSGLSLLPLVSEGGGLMCVCLLRLICTCHPSPNLPTFVFMSREVSHLLLDLNIYGGTSPLGMLLFLKRTADVMASRLSPCIFMVLRLAGDRPNVTPILKGPPSSSVANYRPISITSVLSKVFERLVSDHLGQFMDCHGVLPTTQFAYQKSLVTCDALVHVPYTAECIGSGLEARIVQIYFSAAFDRVAIRAFSIGSALWVLEVLCCLY